MTTLPGEGSLLRIFIGESDRHAGMLLYEWIVRTAREHGLAGATVLRGVEGFSPQPPADTTIGPGDTLVAIGTPATLGRLERLLAPPSAVSRG